MSQLILILLTLLLESPGEVDGLAVAAGLPAAPQVTQEEPKKVEPPARGQEPPEPAPAEAAPPQEEAKKAAEAGTEAAAETAAGAQQEEEVGAAVPERMTTEEAPAGEAEKEPSWFDRWKSEGKFRARYGLRYDYRRYSSRPFSSIGNGTDRDHLFRAYLEAETHGLGHEKLHSYVHIEWFKDLNNQNQPSFTNKLVNTYDSDSKFYLYSGYVEARDVWDRIELRVGRQQVMEVHPVTFDGASAKMDRFYLLDMPAEVRVFGGAITKLYTNLDDTWVGGGALLVEPHENLDLELRDTVYQKNRLEAEARWRPQEMVSLLGMYGFINSRSRDARAEAEIALADANLTVTGGYYQLFRHDFRLDYLTGQDARRLTERYLLLPQLAPYTEVYVRASWDALDWMTVGGEYLDHKLRDRFDESPYDVDFREWGGWVDFRAGPGTLRSEVRYYHADRNPVSVIQPRFPQPPVITQAKVGERNHLEVHLHGGVEFYKPGWGADAGIVWHSVDYSDVYASVDDEESIDYYLQLRAKLTKRATFLVRYELTRDMGYFMPYFDRMHAFTWMLDVTL